MELIRFRRQYLITTKEVTELDGWQKETFNGMNVYAEQSLQVHKRNIGVCVKKRPEIALKMLYVSKRDLKQA